MQTALARQPEERKSHAAPSPAEAVSILSSEAVLGAPAGTPLFLRRLGGVPPLVQREEAPENFGEEKLEEEEEPALQAKLEVNEPGDVWEREADGVAARLQQDEDEGVQRKPAFAGPSPSGLSVPVPDSGAPISGAVRERIEPVLGAVEAPADYFGAVQ